MQFHYQVYEDLANLQAPSYEERLMFECFAREENEKGANILNNIVETNPDRFEYLVFGLLEDRPDIATKVANRHIAQLLSPPKPTSLPVPTSGQSEKVKAGQGLPHDGLEAISKEDLQLLETLPPMKFTLPPKFPTCGEPKLAP